jgi:hypothetical protein
MRFGNIVMVYFVMGAVMFGAGLIGWSDAGFATVLLDNPENQSISANEETGDSLNSLDGPVGEAAGSSGEGGLLSVLNLVTSIADFLFWPISLFLTLNAPPSVVLLFGGAPTTAFYMGLLLLVRSSA